VFGGHTRDMIAAWQKSRGFPDTTFLTGPENQTLLRDASPAIARFDDDQKKADALSAAAKPATAAQPPQTAAASVPAAPASGPDGLWRGTYHCLPATRAGRHGGGSGSAEFTMNVQVRIAGGSGTWVRPGSGPGTGVRGNQSLAVHVNGSRATVTRSYIPPSTDGSTTFAGSISANFDGNSITGQGLETNSAGRVCEINLTR
jgi:hypothetical protein